MYSYNFSFCFHSFNKDGRTPWTVLGPVLLSGIYRLWPSCWSQAVSSHQDSIRGQRRPAGLTRHTTWTSGDQRRTNVLNVIISYSDRQRTRSSHTDRSLKLTRPQLLVAIAYRSRQPSSSNGCPQMLHLPTTNWRKRQLFWDEKLSGVGGLTYWRRTLLTPSLSPPSSTAPVSGWPETPPYFLLLFSRSQLGHMTHNPGSDLTILRHPSAIVHIAR